MLVPLLLYLPPLLIVTPILTTFYSTITSPEKTICHLGWPNYVAIRYNRTHIKQQVFPEHSHPSPIMGKCQWYDSSMFDSSPLHTKRIDCQWLTKEPLTIQRSWRRKASVSLLYFSKQLYALRTIILTNRYHQPIYEAILMCLFVLYLRHDCAEIFSFRYNNHSQYAPFIIYIINM